jgi:hypothetical protein
LAVSRTNTLIFLIQKAGSNEKTYQRTLRN